LANRKLALPDAAPLDTSSLPLTFDDRGAHRLVFVNGRYVPTLSSAKALPAGAIVESLGQALERDPEAFERVFASKRHETTFAALNAAFMADGVHLRIPRGVAIEEPIHVYFVATLADAAIHPRNVVILDEGAQATVVEHYVGLDGAASFTNAITQAFLAGRASLAHYKVQQETTRGLHIAGIHVAQAHGSRFESHSIAQGAALSRNDITTSFDGEGCEAALDGLFVAGGRQHVDHHTHIDHAKPHGTSREYYKGILDGGARGVFNGKVIVHPGAQKSDAHLVSRNLLLSKTAEVDAKPELTIDADDVKCSHGATVGQLDLDGLFYLRSRGLPEALARALLIYAFAREIVDRIRVVPLRGALERVLLARLPEGDRIREAA
jgi:Fe-S cluster assembly protein SufD